ncbi:hypothetical protein L195_g018293 [Trifolium pratense]|uniref:Retrovirus-related Pol polyprotein from transposon TNT 1-94 n=1 Tax=Trifolium pratense TaxID=57577 RepID=A0A2K3MWC8_TRIPR|nr:hypothetical protein L195_g018293 [Trifolium pratense]
MKVVFCAQDLWNLVTVGMPSIGARATDEENEAHKELKKKDYKEKVKEVRLQTHKRRFDLIQMEENESVADFFTKVTRLVNQIMVCGEVIETKSVVAKILRSLTPKFDYLVAAIEESKKLSELSKEELLGSSESHEQRMAERAAGKAKAEVALQAQPNKEKKNKGKWNGNKGRGGHNNGNNKNSKQEASCSSNKQGVDWLSLNRIRQTMIVQDCKVTADNQVNDEGELVHYAFLAYTEPVSMNEALSNPKWINAMSEELNSIEDNNDTCLLEQQVTELVFVF